jgi:hypothetical protein
MPITREQLDEAMRAKGWVRQPDGSYKRPARGPQPGPRTGEEEQLLRRRGPAKPKVARAVHPKFHITIIVRISDRRVRDLDAAATTLLDCLIALRRRLENSLPAYNKG